MTTNRVGMGLAPSSERSEPNVKTAPDHSHHHETVILSEATDPMQASLSAGPSGNSHGTTDQQRRKCLATSVPHHADPGSFASPRMTAFSIKRDLHKAARLFAQTLREIFDESAYDRFLQRTNLAPSTTAYAAFQHEHATAKAHRPKCC